MLARSLEPRHHQKMRDQRQQLNQEGDETATLTQPAIIE